MTARTSLPHPSPFGLPLKKRWQFARDYLFAVTALNLLWEIGQLPLYTI